MSDTQNQTAVDAFSQFWGDFMSRMGVPLPNNGSTTPAGNTPAFNETAKHMQRIFFDAMAKYCDEYMRSEQFLNMMKQTMDRSLAMKQQIDQFLSQAQRGMQAPVKGDVDDMASLMRSFEERVLTRLERLEKNAAAVEEPRRKESVAKASQAIQPSARGPASHVESKGKAKKKKSR